MIDKEVTRINLLPWREDFLLYENRKFGIVAAVVFIIGSLSLALWYRMYEDEKE